jgi:hypothetical protein
LEGIGIGLLAGIEGLRIAWSCFGGSPDLLGIVFVVFGGFCGLGSITGASRVLLIILGGLVGLGDFISGF